MRAPRCPSPAGARAAAPSDRPALRSRATAQVIFPCPSASGSTAARRGDSRLSPRRVQSSRFLLDLRARARIYGAKMGMKDAPRRLLTPTLHFGAVETIDVIPQRSERARLPERVPSAPGLARARRRAGCHHAALRPQRGPPRAPWQRRSERSLCRTELARAHRSPPRICAVCASS